jgi:alkylation response protein AidB-like acyl-CoA dehydrogenase
MNLNFSDEQQMLRDQVQKFCESDYSFNKREEILKSDLGYDADLWKLFSELGWLSLPFAEENGGFGYGPIELSVLFEEFGKVLIVEPYLSTIVLSGSVLDKSSYDGRADLIESITSGASHISLAYLEEGSKNNPAFANTTIANSAGSLTLNGTKTLVLNGGNASKLIVSAMMDDELVLAIVDSEGLSKITYPTIDAQSCAEISFENVQLDNAAIISKGSESIDLLNNAINIATLCISAESIGCMTACYVKTVEYTKSREQFGQPISNFQVLQHKMVDMFIESEVCKSLLFKAMLECESNEDTKNKSVSALKAQIGLSGKLVAQDAVQLHGGMGVSDEMSIGHYLKKLIAVDALFGNSNYHLNKYSQL